MITLQGLTKKQHIIAEALWHKCQTQNDVNAVLKVFGHDARVVYELMIAHTMDQYMAVDEAKEVLDRIAAR